MRTILVDGKSVFDSMLYKLKVWLGILKACNVSLLSLFNIHYKFFWGKSINEILVVRESRSHAHNLNILMVLDILMR